MIRSKGDVQMGLEKWWMDGVEPLLELRFKNFRGGFGVSSASVKSTGARVGCARAIIRLFNGDARWRVGMLYI
jgi:hypothetical protein